MQAQYVFLPSRETGPISVVRCVHYPMHAHVGVLLLFSVALFEAGSHWTGNLLFLLHWLASEPHLSPSHSTEITDIHLLGFRSKRSVHWVNSPVSLSISWHTLSTSYPQRLLLYCFWSPTTFCFVLFFTVKHSSQPADPWEFPRLLTYKGQNYFCNNTKTLFILEHWHLHWLSKWTDE